MRKVTLNIHVYFEWTAERYVGSDLTKLKIQVAAPDDVTFKVNLTCGNRLLYQSLLNVKVFTRFHERLDFFPSSQSTLNRQNTRYMFEPHKEDEKMKSDAQIKLRLIS